MVREEHVLVAGDVAPTLHPAWRAWKAEDPPPGLLVAQQFTGGGGIEQAFALCLEGLDIGRGEPALDIVGQRSKAQLNQPHERVASPFGLAARNKSRLLEVAGPLREAVGGD